MIPDERRAEFLRALTSRHDGLVVWKHLDRALLGRGDIDAAATTEQTPAIAADARTLAPTLLHATHMISCEHVADKHLQFFVQPDRLPQLFELDLCTQPSRGLAPWARPDLMAQLAVTGPQGIRRLRPGAEALVSIVYHGLSRSGRARMPGDEHVTVEAGLASDREGMHAAIDVLAPQPARRPLHLLASRLRDDQQWDPGAARRAFWAFVASGLAHPDHASRRAVYRLQLSMGHECVMSRLARHHDRQVPSGGLDAFLCSVSADGHETATL